MGRDAFLNALDNLDADLRAPYEAAARAQSAEAFASTMLVAGFALAGLTLASFVLLRPGREPSEPDEEDLAPATGDPAR